MNISSPDYMSSNCLELGGKQNAIQLWSQWYDQAKLVQCIHMVYDSLNAFPFFGWGSNETKCIRLIRKLTHHMSSHSHIKGTTISDDGHTCLLHSYMSFRQFAILLRLFFRLISKKFKFKSTSSCEAMFIFLCALISRICAF